jgi:UDP-glucose 4-epimerase
VDFAVEMTGRRAGDAAAVVANAALARTELGWTPRFDDLNTIVGHALAWETALGRRNSAAMPPEPAPAVKA